MAARRTVGPPAEAAIANVLRGVIDPELGDNIVDLGMVQRIDIDVDHSVAITVALTTAGCPLRAQLMKDVKIRVGTLPGVSAVRVHFGEMTTEQKRNVMSRARRDHAIVGGPRGYLDMDGRLRA